MISQFWVTVLLLVITVIIVSMAWWVLLTRPSNKKKYPNINLKGDISDFQMGELQ